MPNYAILPEDSIVVRRFSPDKFAALEKIPERTPRFVFVDYSADPSPYRTEQEIQEILEIFKRQFPRSRCIWLTVDCADYDIQVEDAVWYPFPFLNNYVDPVVQPRQKRIGCLNRRNAPHRVWMMHNLMSQGLIDHERDIYSIMFKNIYSGHRENLTKWDNKTLSLEDRTTIRNYPDYITTLTDDFPNDHSVGHPAWNTALAIVTETEVNHRCIMSEKTVKAILSRSCFMLYTGQEELSALTKMGFDLGTFDQHPTEFNIDPVINMARQLDTESVALDYYHSKLDIINHNYDWFRGGGWLAKYREKLDPFVN